MHRQNQTQIGEERSRCLISSVVSHGFETTFPCWMGPGRTPLHVTAMVGRCSTAELLLAHGAAVDATDDGIGLSGSSCAHLRSYQIMIIEIHIYIYIYTQSQ